jgi:hypothetical protein
MRRPSSILLFLLLFLDSYSQADKFSGQYIGHYGSDLLVMEINVDLKEDATFRITQKSSFLKNGTWKKEESVYTGEWIYKNKWIYFKQAAGEDPCPYIDQVRHNKHAYKMRQKGYSFSLKPQVDKDTGNKSIFFHIADDRFEQAWVHNGVFQINPTKP